MLESTVNLENGLKAYPLPELGTQEPGVGWRLINAPNVEEVKAKLDLLLSSIKEQGGEIRGIITVATQGEKQPGVVGSRDQKTTFLIIEK